jgi:hypothetical protein
MLANPLLPQGFLTFDGSGRLLTVEIKANRQVDLAADGKGEKMRDTGSRSVQSEQELMSVSAFARLLKQSA